MKNSSNLHIANLHKIHCSLQNSYIFVVRIYSGITTGIYYGIVTTTTHCEPRIYLSYILLLLEYIYLLHLVLWQIVNTLYGINITFHQILGLDKHFKYDSITTIICFIIYKEWLLLSLDGKHRHPEIAFEYFKHGIAICLEIYKQCDSINEHLGPCPLIRLSVIP